MFKIASAAIACLFLLTAGPLQTARAQSHAGKEAPDNSAVTSAIGPASDSCERIAPPPQKLETYSKYDQRIGSKSVIDETAAETRRRIINPIDDAIRQLEFLAVSDTSKPAARRGGDCVSRNLETWAAAGALTDMATSDANLSRDRFMASIAGIAIMADAKGAAAAEHKRVRAWLAVIANQTIAYYGDEAGPTSRRNNHRYWAGLSVGRIGYLLHDDKMMRWAGESLDIGLCQVDSEGYLPLELSRRTKALDYHLYAFIALRSLHDVMAQYPAGMASRCPGAMARLQGRVETALVASAAFEAKSGYRQDAPSRRNLAAATKLVKNRPQDSVPGINY